MGGYVAGRRVVINNVTYNAGDTVPLAELMPFYFKNLVRRGNLTEEQVDGVDEAALNAAVSAAVDALVDGAPAALDTLNEIAAAIGDDGSFSSSVVLKGATDASTFSFVVDEDDMSSNSALLLPTQQSVKAYVDNNSGGGSIDELSDATNDGSTLYLGATIPGTASGALRNVAISGDGTALDAITTGDNNVAIGANAASAATSAADSVGVGYESLLALQGGFRNTAVGSGALKSVVSTHNNTAIGMNAGDSATGDGGVYAGYLAGASVTSGDDNIFIGNAADTTSGTVTHATCMGTSASADANYTTAIGSLSSATALRATAVGRQAFATGSESVAVGVGTDATAANSVAIGGHATTGAQATHTGSVAIGVSTAGTAAATTTTDEIVLGVAAHTVNIPGSLTVAGATPATAVDELSDGDTSSGTDTLAIGTNAGRAISTAAGSTAIGQNALSDVAGNLTGTGNTAVGTQAGQSVEQGATFNTLVGYLAASSLTTGSSNTCVGRYSASSLTIGNNNTCLGRSTNVDTGTRSDSVVVGYALVSGAENGSIAIGSSTVTGNILRVESGVLTIGGVKWVSLSTLQTETAAATDFADFQSRIAALT